MGRNLDTSLPFKKINISNKKNLKKICENEQYKIYLYKDETDHLFEREYIIGENKKQKGKFFKCSEKFDLVCLFNNSLFMCNETGELERESSFIHRIDLSKKSTEVYNLRSAYGELVNINGFGRYYSTEHYFRMVVVNNNLIISGHREKSDDERYESDSENRDTNFEIIFEYNNDKFIPYFKEDGKLHPFYNTIQVSNGKTNMLDSDQMEFITIMGILLSCLSILAGLIGSIIMSFKSIVWIIVLVIGIIGFIISLRIYKKKFY